MLLPMMAKVFSEIEGSTSTMSSCSWMRRAPAITLADSSSLVSTLGLCGVGDGMEHLAHGLLLTLRLSSRLGEIAASGCGEREHLERALANILPPEPVSTVGLHGVGDGLDHLAQGLLLTLRLASRLG